MNQLEVLKTSSADLAPTALPKPVELIVDENYLGLNQDTQIMHAIFVMQIQHLLRYPHSSTKFLDVNIEDDRLLSLPATEKAVSHFARYLAETVEEYYLEQHQLAITFEILAYPGKKGRRLLFYNSNIQPFFFFDLIVTETNHRERQLLHLEFYTEYETKLQKQRVRVEDAPLEELLVAEYLPAAHPDTIFTDPIQEVLFRTRASCISPETHRNVRAEEAQLLSFSDRSRFFIRRICRTLADVTPDQLEYLPLAYQEIYRKFPGFIEQCKHGVHVVRVGDTPAIVVLDATYHYLFGIVFTVFDQPTQKGETKYYITAQGRDENGLPSLEPLTRNMYHSSYADLLLCTLRDAIQYQTVIDDPIASGEELYGNDDSYNDVDDLDDFDDGMSPVTV